MKIYIAGAISNNPDYQSQFEKAETYIKSKNHTPLNPVKNIGFEYKDYIDMGLAELSKCDAIYMLIGWVNSNGARLEKHYAETVGLQITYEE